MVTTKTKRKRKRKKTLLVRYEIKNSYHAIWSTVALNKAHD